MTETEDRASLCGKPFPEASDVELTVYEFGKAVVCFLTRFTHRLDVDFQGELPNGGFILACNHVSDLDPVMLGIAFPKQIRYMAKEELFRVPVLGPVIRALGAFPVARGKGDTGALAHAGDIVRQGGVLGIFPEGGRSRDGKFHKVKSGTAVVASQTGADIVPACLIYEPRRLFHRRKVIVRFGETIPNRLLQITERSKTELRAANALLGERIAGLLGVEAP